MIKYLPYNFYDFQNMEQWLNENAEKGLFLESISWFAKFKKCEGKKATYRIEPALKPKAGNKAIDEEKIELYKQFNWQYVCSVRNTINIFVSFDEIPAEIHTDPELLAENYDALCKIMRSYFRLLVFSIVAYGIFLAFFGYSFIANPKYSILNSNPLFFIILITTNMVENLFSMESYFLLKRQVKSLENGEEPKRRKNGKLWPALTALSQITLITLALFGLAQILKQDYNQWEKPMDDFSQNLPFISLDIMENDDDFQFSKRAYPSEPEPFEVNRAFFESSFLAPEQYEFDQAGFIPGEKWLDDSGQYEPKLNIHYYKLRFSFLEDILTKDLTNRFEEYSDCTKEYLYDDRFDYLVSFTEPKYEMQKLVACKDKVIVTISYQGRADFSLLVESAYNLIESQN